MRTVLAPKKQNTLQPVTPRHMVICGHLVVVVFTMLVFSKVNLWRSCWFSELYGLMVSMLGRDKHSDRRNSLIIWNISVTLHCANGLIACDSFGKSDPYCYVDLGNQRFRSRTIYKTVNPGMTSKNVIVKSGSFLSPMKDELGVLRLTNKFQNSAWFPGFFS